MIAKGKTQFAQGVAWVINKLGRRKNVSTLTQALAVEAECGCGIECECYGIYTIPNWDSATGEVDGFHAIFIVDGVQYNLPVDEAKAAIDLIKAGGGFTPPVVAPESLVSSAAAPKKTAKKKSTKATKKTEEDTTSTEKA